jgi:hypothetical protein
MKVQLCILLLSLLLVSCAAIKSSRGKSSTKKLARKSYDEDEDEEEEPIKQSKKSSKSNVKTTKSMKKGSKSQLVKWNNGMKKGKPRGIGALAMNLNIKERLEGLASQSSNVYKSAYRQVKVCPLESYIDSNS